MQSCVKLARCANGLVSACCHRSPQQVYAAASEDTDTITFGAPKVIRRLAFSEARKLPVRVVSHRQATRLLTLLWWVTDPGVRLHQGAGGAGADPPAIYRFVYPLRLRLLRQHQRYEEGCAHVGWRMRLSYSCCCGLYTGIGPKTALKLIRTHGDIEGVLAHIDAMPTDKCKYSVPDEFRELFAEARKLFSHADVTSGSEIDLKWTDCDEEGLKTFLVAEKGFNVDRVERGIQKIKKAKSTYIRHQQSHELGRLLARLSVPVSKPHQSLRVWGLM